MDHVPNPLLLRICGTAGNRTRISGSVARNHTVRSRTQVTECACFSLISCEIKKKRSSALMVFIVYRRTPQGCECTWALPLFLSRTWLADENCASWNSRCWVEYLELSEEVAWESYTIENFIFCTCDRMTLQRWFKDDEIVGTCNMREGMECLKSEGKRKVAILRI
jgi:hypothetical protein